MKMKDSYNRTINYMRISITDHCNFRCQYCMPEGIKWAPSDKLLTFEEILTVCKVAVSKGICDFKVTGGEPLVRPGCIEFLRKLKQMDGVRSVTLTTNGLLLEKVAEELAKIKIDSVNISVDSLVEGQFDKLTGTKGNLPKILSAIDCLQSHNIKTKVNAVLLRETVDQIVPLAMLAKDRKIDVKFIEIMPVGLGRKTEGISAKEALKILQKKWPDLHIAKEVKGNGPAIYYRSKELQGSIGLIHAVTNPFCEDCNRIRMTSQGILKPCLCYEAGINLREILRSGAGEEKLSEAFDNAMTQKPEAHCFSHIEDMTEQRGMSEIGG